ncbi:MAG: hypothetical protein H6696_06170 [Deferribacteres bacterium]|nr:hypothetical protein [candidate division KSB1 bacterium]MCB9501504.1 hypothetical protein [Deferribacteres bacterium]
MKAPDYSKYTLTELIEASESIDRFTFPERAKKLDELIRERKLRGEVVLSNSSNWDATLSAILSAAFSSVILPTIISIWILLSDSPINGNGQTEDASERAYFLILFIGMPLGIILLNIYFYLLYWFLRITKIIASLGITISFVLMVLMFLMFTGKKWLYNGYEEPVEFVLSWLLMFLFCPGIGSVVFYKKLPLSKNGKLRV